MTIERASSLWRHRDFMALWSGATVSEVGSQVSQLAIPLAALTVLHTGSAGVGLVRALGTLPYLLVGLFAGVWVERRRRRFVLVVNDAVRLVLFASIPIAYALDGLTLVQLYLVAFIGGVATVLFDVAYQSYLPRLVEHHQLMEGNAKLRLSESVAQVGGPGIAGLLIRVLGPAPAVAVDALSFAASALGIAAIRSREPEPVARSGRGSTASLAAAGLRYVGRHPILRWIAACSTIANLSLAMVETVLLVFLARTLHLDAGRIGLVFLLGGTGVVAGALAAPRLVRRQGPGPACLAGVCVGAFGALLAPLAAGRPSGMWLVAASQWLVSFGLTAYNVTQVTVRQAVCPDAMQGRMTATMRFLTWGVLPLGNLAGGLLGSMIGLRSALWVSAVVGAAAIPWLLPKSIWSLRVLPTQEVEAGEGYRRVSSSSVAEPPDAPSGEPGGPPPA
jgi:MFS family permease